MEKIAWDQSFSVGVTKLDAQHEGIIHMINLLIGHPQAAVDSETLSETLTRMTAYASEHFQFEERLMAEHGYPELPAHRQEHLAFRKRAATFCLETMEGRASVPEDVLTYLREWWTRHILSTDTKYRTFFAERGLR